MFVGLSFVLYGKLIMPAQKFNIHARMPYIRIGGSTVFQPPLIAQLQTDGSFSQARQPRGRAAAYLETAAQNMIYKQLWEVQDAINSTETEWASVAFGLKFALENDESCVGIENDNFGVIAALIHKSKLRHEYARYYRNTIVDLSKYSEWIGLRWIPRQFNKADKILR
jgi:hypothetical protein